MSDDDKQIETFTGTITSIGRREANKPRSVKLDDGKGGQYEKTCRVWEYAYNEDPDAEKEVSEVFEKLEGFYKEETLVTVEIEVREYRSRGQKRKQNLIIDVWAADDEKPKAKDPADDWGEKAEPEKKSERPNAGSIAPADLQRIAKAVVKELHDAGFVVLGTAASKMEANPDQEKEMRADFLKTAEAEDIGPKALQKHFDRLFPEQGAWEDVANIEQLTALADVLGIEWE